jgi:hypothetical protein
LIQAEASFHEHWTLTSPSPKLKLKSSYGFILYINFRLSQFYKLSLEARVREKYPYEHKTIASILTQSGTGSKQKKYFKLYFFFIYLLGKNIDLLQKASSDQNFIPQW